MPFENHVPDKTLLSKVNSRLARCGSGSRTHVAAIVRNGAVTLSGTVDFDYQKRPLLRAASGVDGVRMVIDQLQVKPPAHWTKDRGSVSEMEF